MVQKRKFEEVSTNDASDSESAKSIAMDMAEIPDDPLTAEELAELEGVRKFIDELCDNVLTVMSENIDGCVSQSDFKRALSTNRLTKERSVTKFLPQNFEGHIFVVARELIFSQDVIRSEKRVMPQPIMIALSIVANHLPPNFFELVYWWIIDDRLSFEKQAANMDWFVSREYSPTSYACIAQDHRLKYLIPPHLIEIYQSQIVGLYHIAGPPADMQVFQFGGREVVIQANESYLEYCQRVGSLEKFDGLLSQYGFKPFDGLVPDYITMNLSDASFTEGRFKVRVHCPITPTSTEQVVKPMGKMFKLVICVDAKDSSVTSLFGLKELANYCVVDIRVSDVDSLVSLKTNMNNCSQIRGIKFIRLDLVKLLEESSLTTVEHNLKICIESQARIQQKDRTTWAGKAIWLVKGSEGARFPKLKYIDSCLLGEKFFLPLDRSKKTLRIGMFGDISKNSLEVAISEEVRGKYQFVGCRVEGSRFFASNHQPVVFSQCVISQDIYSRALVDKGVVLDKCLLVSEGATPRVVFANLAINCRIDQIRLNQHGYMSLHQKLSQVVGENYFELCDFVFHNVSRDFELSTTKFTLSLNGSFDEGVFYQGAINKFRNVAVEIHADSYTQLLSTDCLQEILEKSHRQNNLVTLEASLEQQAQPPQSTLGILEQVDAGAAGLPNSDVFLSGFEDEDNSIVDNFENPVAGERSDNNDDVVSSGSSPSMTPN